MSVILSYTSYMYVVTKLRGEWDSITPLVIRGHSWNLRKTTEKMWVAPTPEGDLSSYSRWTVCARPPTWTQRAISNWPKYTKDVHFKHFRRQCTPIKPTSNPLRRCILLVWALSSCDATVHRATQFFAEPLTNVNTGLAVRRSLLCHGIVYDVQMLTRFFDNKNVLTVFFGNNMLSNLQVSCSSTHWSHETVDYKVTR